MVTDLDLVPVNHKAIRPASHAIADLKEQFKRRINLTPLAPGQEVEIQAIVKLGIGRQHAKFKPACRVLFVPNRHVKIHYDVIEELKLNKTDLQWFVEQCPTKVFTVETKETKDVENAHLSIIDHDRCMACQSCIIASRTLINKRMPEEEVDKRMTNGTLKPIAEFEVYGQDDSRTDFRFAIQSVGGMMPLQILVRSMNVLVQRVIAFSKDVSAVRE
jgi:NAD-dependent dihydropyrimidine dehydrogenase PreA subunit